MTLYITIFLYLLFAFIAYQMAKTEHIAEHKSFTVGERLLCFIPALFSVAGILIICISAWFQKIKGYGYWDKPLIKDEQ